MDFSSFFKLLANTYKHFFKAGSPPPPPLCSHHCCCCYCRVVKGDKNPFPAADSLSSVQSFIHTSILFFGDWPSCCCPPPPPHSPCAPPALLLLLCWRCCWRCCCCLQTWSASSFRTVQNTFMHSHRHTHAHTQRLDMFLQWALKRRWESRSVGS